VTRRRPLARLAALAVALAALALPVSATADTIPAVGVNDIRSDAILLPNLDWNGVGDLDLTAGAGIELYRARIQLNCVDPSHSGTFDFTSPSAACSGISYDQLIGALAARGMTLLPVLINFSGQLPQPPTVDGAGGSPTTGEFAAFAAAAAARYGPAGSYWASCACTPRPIESWEIWNEENNGYWWSGAVSPSGYAALFAATRGALRTVDPQARVVVGGLTFDPNGQPSFVAPAAMVQALAAGNANAFDAVAVHPYSTADGASPPQLAVSAMTMIDKVAAAVAADTGPGPQGAPRQQIWVTEMGWSTQVADQMTVAIGLQLFFALLDNGERARDNIGPVLWYDLRDNATLATRDDQLGLRLTAAGGADGGAKPAWSVLASAAQREGAIPLPPALTDRGPFLTRARRHPARHRHRRH
jgi:hypothetical protein